ncbi:hypothetical protein METP2_02748 [Methanosarcinales archaeon]|nr:hypothetical protein [Flavobacteriales bacterium]CAG0993277.1 hypothetical protein METP2_02748 [Methanosarcinales archaeon]
MLGTIRSWWRDLSIGVAPEVINEYLLSGNPNAQMKREITKNINIILSENKRKHYKFGKTGHALTRIDYDDYRKASYTKMYLLYMSPIANFVEFLEKYYATKYYANKYNKNVDVNSLGLMKSRDGNYYLYLVV